MHLGFLSRFPRRPAAWAITLGSLGLALLAAGPATSWSEEAPGTARVSLLDDEEALDQLLDDGEVAGSARISGDEAEPADEEEAGRVSVRRHEPEERAGRVSVRRHDPEAPAGNVRIRRAAPPSPAPAAPGAARIKDASPARSPRPALVAPSKVIPPKPVQAARVNPTAQRYPFEASVVTARPAPARPQAAPAVAHAAATAPAYPAGALAARPSAVKPVQHLSSRRTPFLDDTEEEDEDEGPEAVAAVDSDDAASAPAMFEEQQETAEQPDATPVEATADCPQVSEADVANFGNTIDAVTLRRPIRALRADMQARLSHEHSSLMDESDRAAVRERGRCAAERDRAIVRYYYRQRYGAGYDRSPGGWSDENLAPEFPFCYHPLYFEDANLERCGYSQGCCCQPLVSGFQFYGNVALLPFKMLMLPPCSYVYPQCDCEPCTRYGCCDNMWGPRPESLFSSPCFSSRRCRW